MVILAAYLSEVLTWTNSPNPYYNPVGPVMSLSYFTTEETEAKVIGLAANECRQLPPEPAHCSAGLHCP